MSTSSLSELEYEREVKRLESELRPKLTDEFLAVLAQAVRTCGWSVDYIESSRFVYLCYHPAGKEAPELESFQSP